ncbi:MAG: hypothetical protein ACRD10_12070, partial [Terriglobia bacterium]
MSVLIFGHAAGRHDELRTHRCRYNNKTGALACSGGASLKLESKPRINAAPGSRSGQPLFIQTSDVSYDPLDSSVKTAGNVSFSFGSATGTAKGLTYGARTGLLSLGKNVRARFPARATNQPSVDLRAGGLLYKKAAGQILLRGPVRITQGLRRVSASAGTIFLNSQSRINHLRLSGDVSGSSSTPKEKAEITGQELDADFDPATAQVRDVQAFGDARIRTSGAGQTAARELYANRVQLNVSGSNMQPRTGRALGSVRLVFDSPKTAATVSSTSGSLGGFAGGRKILTASELRFSFTAAGLLGAADTEGPGKIVVFPAHSQDDTRTLSAGELQLAFGPRGRLQRLVGLRSTQIVDSAPPGAKPGFVRETFGDQFVANLNAAGQTIETIRQDGSFRFKDGDRQASAAEALFQSQGQDLTLIGDPQLWDSHNRMRARRIRMNLAQRSADGLGHVQSIHFVSPPSPRPGSSGPVSNRHNAAHQPLMLTADRVTVSRNKQEALYEGNVRAWQGANVLECSSLKVDRRSQQI